MNRRDLLKAALLATPTAQAVYMASKYGAPNKPELDSKVVSLAVDFASNEVFYYATEDGLNWIKIENANDSKAVQI